MSFPNSSTTPTTHAPMKSNSSGLTIEKRDRVATRDVQPPT